jgi:hypothetical protein
MNPIEVVFDDDFEAFAGYERGGAGQQWGVVHIKDEQH